MDLMGISFDQQVLTGSLAKRSPNQGGIRDAANHVLFLFPLLPWEQVSRG
jgi:hypothetical protein